MTTRILEDLWIGSRGLANLRTSRPAKLFTADGLATPEWSSLALSGESSMRLMGSCQPDTTYHAPFSITHWPIPSASRDSATQNDANRARIQRPFARSAPSSNSSSSVCHISERTSYDYVLKRGNWGKPAK